ncbi:MAG TPA: DHA2 family efflux MFS transporter permease subunit [Acidimicrobiales bacterium]|nr:DHA2 family efflux MFS transporter permease subunit [Acidimicrobiales bacterium]
MPPADAPATLPPPVTRAGRAPAVVFGLTSLGAFVTSLDLSIVNVAFPSISRSFTGASTAGLAWILTGYSIVFGSLLVIGGRVGDRSGRRRTFFSGLAVFGVGSLLCGLAPSAALLVAGRLLQGAGAAFTLPSSLGLLLAAFGPERRSQMVALWSGIGALAVATGPTLGALLITEWGWRLVFMVNVPICAATILIGSRVLEESRHPSDRRIDFGGVALLSVALAALVLAISEGPDWGWAGPRTLGALAVCAVLLPAFVWRCRVSPEPAIDLSLLRSSTLTLADTATAVYAMGFFAMLLGNILFLTGVWHYSILHAGLAITPSPIVVACLSGFAGRLAHRVGFRPVLIAGSAFFTGALVWYGTVVGPHSDYLGVWLPGALLAGIGIALTFPVLGAAAVSILPPARLAVGSALNQTARQIGGAIGVAILVAVVGSGHGPDALRHFRNLWAFEAGTAALTGVVAVAIRRRPALATASAGVPAAAPSCVIGEATQTA